MLRGGSSAAVSVTQGILYVAAGTPGLRGTGWHRCINSILAVTHSERLVKHDGLSQKCLKIAFGYQIMAVRAWSERLGTPGAVRLLARSSGRAPVPAAAPRSSGARCRTWCWQPRTPRGRSPRRGGRTLPRELSMEIAMIPVTITELRLLPPVRPGVRGAPRPSWSSAPSQGDSAVSPRHGSQPRASAPSSTL